MEEKLGSYLTLLTNREITYGNLVIIRWFKYWKHFWGGWTFLYFVNVCNLLILWVLAKGSFWENLVFPWFPWPDGSYQNGTYITVMLCELFSNSILDPTLTRLAASHSEYKVAPSRQSNRLICLKKESPFPNFIYKKNIIISHKMIRLWR